MSCAIHERQRGECKVCPKVHALIAAECVETLKRIQTSRNNRKAQARPQKPSAYSRHVNHVLTTRRA